AIESSLRLLEQSHASWKARLLGSGHRQLLRPRVERSGDGDRDLLIIERKPGRSKPAVPRPPQIVENQCGGAYRRDLLFTRQLRRPPWQKRRRPIGGVMAKPGLRGMDDPSRCFARLRAREAADDPLPVPLCPATKVSCDRILRQIEEGRQRWLLRQ